MKLSELCYGRNYNFIIFSILFHQVDARNQRFEPELKQKPEKETLFLLKREPELSRKKISAYFGSVKVQIGALLDSYK